LFAEDTRISIRLNIDCRC